MGTEKTTLLFVAALLATLPAARVHACGANQTEVYKSATTAWCVDNGIITQYGAFPTAFFAFGDNVVTELVAIFHVPAQGVYTFEAGPHTGGAHTGSECCGLGVTVTGDAFYGDGYGVIGFWGYLLALHEMINDWTGQVSSGWPTDFWADHVSAFPNSMDWHIMETLGVKDNDPNLKKAAIAQKARFYPGGDSPDPRVPMFDQIFALPNMGFDGYSRIFGFVSGDKLDWDAVADQGNNPDQRRTEYVIAYLSLGAGKSLLSAMQAGGVGNGQSDGHAGDVAYTAAAANVDAIANAHCAIAAAAAQGKSVTADRAALQAGKYGTVAAKGTCGSGCPAECGCKSSTNACVAPWLADGTGGGGGGGTGGGGSGGNGGAGSGDSKGCGCQLGRRDTARAQWLVLAGLAAALMMARSRRRR